MSAWKKLAAAPAASAGAKQPTHLYLFTRAKSFCIDISDPSNLSEDATDNSFYVQGPAVYNQLTNTTYVFSESQPANGNNRRIYSFAGKNFTSSSTYDEDATWPTNDSGSPNTFLDWVNGLYVQIYSSAVYKFTLSGTDIGNASLDIYTSGTPFSLGDLGQGIGVDPNNETFYLSTSGNNVGKYDYSGLVSGTSPYISELYTVFQDDPGPLLLDTKNSVAIVQETDTRYVNTLVDSGTAMTEVDGLRMYLYTFKYGQSRFMGAPHDPDTLEFTSDAYIISNNQDSDLYKYSYDQTGTLGDIDQVAYLNTGAGQTYETYFDPWTEVFYVYYVTSGQRRFASYDVSGTTITLLDSIVLSSGAGDPYGITPTY